MDLGKSTKISISLPAGILDLISADVGPTGSVSGWIQQASIALLQLNGRWPESHDEADDLKMVREAREDGIDVKAVLEREISNLAPRQGRTSRREMIV